MALPVSDIEDSAAKDRNRNLPNTINGYPCLVCGKPCSNDGGAVWVYLHDGGSTIVTEQEYENRNAAGAAGGEMGLSPIGSDCYRKHRVALARYVTKL